MFEACSRVHSIDPSCLISLDFILVHADYEQFVGMMIDFKNAFKWISSDNIDGSL